MFNNPDFNGQYIVIVISILLIEIGLCGLYDLNKGFNIAAAVMFILFFIPGVYFICKSVYTIISRMKLRIKNDESPTYIIILQSILSSLIFILLITVCSEVYHSYSVFMNKLFFPGMKYD